MSTVFARLVAQMGWDGRAADQGLQNFQNRVSSAGSAMSTTLRNAVVGALSLAAVKGFFGALREQAEDAVRILRESINTGLSTDTFQAMEKALQRIGLEADDAKGFIETMTERVQDAVTGANLEARTLFQDSFGLTPEKLATLDTVEKQFLAIGDAIQKSANNSDTLRAGTILFGGDFFKLNAGFRVGLDNLIQIEKHAVVAKDTLRALADAELELKDAMAELNAGMKEFAALFAPFLKVTGAAIKGVARGFRDAPLSTREQIDELKESLSRRVKLRALGIDPDGVKNLADINPGSFDLLSKLNSALTSPTDTGSSIGQASNSFTVSRSFDTYAQRGLFLSQSNQRTEQQRFHRDLFEEIAGVKREVAKVSKTIEKEVGGV